MHDLYAHDDFSCGCRVSGFERDLFFDITSANGSQVFKSCVIALMCVVFVYAGVLSVFDSCPDHQQRLSRAPSEPQHEAGPSFSSETSDDSLPTLECAPEAHLLLFAAATSDAAIQMALFKRTLTLSHHSDLSYRLFLSILQI